MVQVLTVVYVVASSPFSPAGPSQGGTGQYPNYPQGQGQQYGGYRPPQPGPPQAQQQRSYGYDQVGGEVKAPG